MNIFIPQPSQSQIDEIDAEIALMAEHGKKISQSKESIIAFFIRAGLFTKSGKPKKKFYGPNPEWPPHTHEQKLHHAWLSRL